MAEGPPPGSVSLSATLLFLGRIRRLLRKPPHVIWARLRLEVRAEFERLAIPMMRRGFGAAQLCSAAEAASIDELWQRLAERQGLLPTGVEWGAAVRGDERATILEAADRAMQRRVDLLGSGETLLGSPIDWHVDFRTGIRWAPAFHRRISYVDLEDPSDVKVPWELSRLQWLLPVGQAYLITGNEDYAAFVRDTLRDWMGANPYGSTVNWTVAMEAALRSVTWIWFFEVFNESAAWRDQAFRLEFLRTLFLHGRHIANNLERSDVNGNHYTADAAGLALLGMFFVKGTPTRWADLGWQILNEEIQKQVASDGVDFEGSVAYHRLVAELFVVPAIYLMASGSPVASEYRARLIAMGRFSRAYTQPSGSAPLLGDADDGRVLPLGHQGLNDHRYLCNIIGASMGYVELCTSPRETLQEALWLLGPATLSAIEKHHLPWEPRSEAFVASGYYVLASGRDHVFVDCADVGLAGRGGHGHNDCLSFEAVIDGVKLITDAGSYVYTSDPGQRNLFRSTAFHNTPMIDDQEINRFISPANLWGLEADAEPEVLEWTAGPKATRLVATHNGYLRLSDPIRPVRSLRLWADTHLLEISDDFVFHGAAPHTDHAFDIPLLLAPGVEPCIERSGLVALHAGGRIFHLRWHDPADWMLTVEPAKMSPRYGIAVDTSRLRWSRLGPPLRLTVRISPASDG